MKLFVKLFVKAVRAKKIVDILLILLPIIALVILIYNYVKINNEKNERQNRTIIRKMPKNKDICKKMISLLSKKEKDKEIKARMKNAKIVEVKDWTNNMYNVLTNKMVVGTKGQNFFRLNTIATECVRAFQKTSRLKTSEVLKILQTVGYAVFIIIALGVNLFSNPFVHKTILTILFAIVLLLEFVRYRIRAKMEADSIKKALVLVEEYLTESNKIEEEEKAHVLVTYQEMNDNLRIIAYTKPLFWMMVRILVVFIIL